MDFFGQQQQAKNRSLFLLILFAAAMLFLAAVVNGIGSLIGFALGQSSSPLELNPYALFITGLFWFIIFCGCFFRWLDVRGGGDRLAKHFRAEQVISTSRVRADNQLINVVSEMAVAASVVQPNIWVMRREPSVNAFVLGSASEPALVVTQGCLDTLDRDELKAVVAHEMGHIVQGDLQINMRLLIVMGGLMAITEVGHGMGGNDPHSENLMAGVGKVLCLFGGMCVFLGTVIRSAFSRKREFLADASAVQFTRNPDALAVALHKIQSGREDRCLNSLFGEELAHLCFQIPRVRSVLGRVLATHPPIKDRIHAIDPHFAVKHRARQKEVKKQQWQRSQQNSSAGARSQSIAGTVPGLVGADSVNAEPSDLANIGAVATFSGLSERLELMLPDAASWLTAIFALFASNEVAQRRQYVNSIAFAYDKPFAAKVEKLLNDIGPNLQQEKLAVIEHVAPKLKTKVKPENRMRLLKNLEKMVELEGESSIENYAALQLIRRLLDADFPVLTQKVDVGQNNESQKNARQKSSADLETKMALLLSLMVEASGNSPERLDAEYSRVLKCYTQKTIERRSSSEPGVLEDMQVAFQVLNAQPLATRELFVNHCREIAHADFYTNRNEWIVLNLFAASLGLDDQPLQSAA